MGELIRKTMKLKIINNSTGRQITTKENKKAKYDKKDICSNALSTGKNKKRISKQHLFRTPIQTRNRAKQKIGKSESKKKSNINNPTNKNNTKTTNKLYKNSNN